MDVISFAGDGLAPELLPSAELADCAGTALEEDARRILSYGSGAGYTPLRELLAERFGVHPHRVLLTNGWLQGFALLAHRRVWNQNVIVEFPTYSAALRMLFNGGANVFYLDMHEQGPNVDELEVFLRVNKASLLYTMPTFHNPTGQSLTLAQRERMSLLVSRAKTALLVEDDSYGLLRFAGEPLPSLFELSARTSVYSTSLSHALAPGLRVGAFVLPHALAGELSELANATYITPVLLAQATVFEFIRRGSLEPHLERLRDALRERRDAMLAALDSHLTGAGWTRPEGGIFLFLRLPPGSNARLILAQAEGVSALAGEDFGGAPNTIRLNFAAAGVDEIETGIERLAAAIGAASPA